MKDMKLIKEDFKKDGYLFIPGFLTAEETEEISQNLDRLIKEVVPTMPRKDVMYEDEENGSTLKQLGELQIYDTFFNSLLESRKFVELAELLLDDRVIAKDLSYFNKPPLIGKPTPAHQDGYYFMLKPSIAVTMWMPMEPVDDENGCVKYVKGSHLEGMRPHGRTQTLGFSQGITNYGSADMAKEVSFPSKPGDLLVHHSLTIHRADGNKSNTRNRKALGLIYYGESANEDKEAKIAYHKKLEQERFQSEDQKK